MKKIKLLVFLALLIFLYGRAYGGEILVIDQPKVRLAIKPGGSQTGIINVNNPSSEDKDVRVYLEDWYYVAGGDGSKEFRSAGSLPISCASWITVAPNQFRLPAYSSVPVHYTVTIPPKVEGGHYAVVFFESLLGEAPSADNRVGVNLAVRVGSLFYIEPEGTINKKVQLDRISATQKQGDIPFKITAHFKNIGNVDITATGIFNIIDKEGMVLARGQFNNAYTLPNDEADISASWDSIVQPGSYDLIITLDLGGTPYVKEAEIKITQAGDIYVTPKD